MKYKINCLNIILFFIYLSVTSVAAQVASYSLNGNLTDNLSTSNLLFQRLGGVTVQKPVFETSANGQQININSKFGLNIPKSLIDKIDVNSSFEIEFTMKVKTLGLDRGRIHILSQQNTRITFAGFSIFADQPDLTKNNFNLTFVHSDGGANKNVPNHNFFTLAALGNYNVGDEIKINLIIDLKNRTWIASVNKNKYNGKFNDDYVWQDIVDAIKLNNWYLNWINGYQGTIGNNPNNFTTQINYDEVNFYIPRKPADQAAIKTAFEEMTAHVGKTKTLTNEQKENYTGEIIVGLSQVYDDLKTDIFSYINTYELNQPILYSNRQEVATSSLPAEARLLISLQQYIHDFQFTTENIDNVAGVKFKFAEIFPGKVKQTAVRVPSAVVAINGKHISLRSVRYGFDNESAKRPTGYYAAPGEIVTITIPSNLIDKGLEVQIGAHTGDLSTKPSQNRFTRVTKSFSLNKISTRVASPFGGGIYIKVAEPSDLGWFDVTISGAVKSPYFRYITGRESSISDWQKDLLDRNVEWADVESEKYMMTLPWINFKSITNPTSLLTQWDNIMDAYNYVGGFPKEAKIKADYFIVDSMLPTPAFGIGYPQAFGNGQVPYATAEFNAGYPTYVLNSSFIKPFNYNTAVLFHEIGHTNSFPRVTGDAESVVHLYASYIYNKLYGFSVDDAFKYSFFQQMDLNQAAIDWMMSHNFRSNIKMSCDPLLKHLPGGECDEIRYQHRGHAKYSEIAKRFGWEFVHKMNKVFYDKNVALDLEADKTKWITTDELVEAASDANNLNMAPLFHFWGYIPSTALAEKLKTKYAPDARFCEMLNHYKTVVPKSSAELDTYIKNSAAAVNSIRYSEYVSKYESENYYKQIIDQIDYILGFYNLKNLENVTKATICGSYTWANNGQTYTQPGIYTGTTTNCTTEKLHLTTIQTTWNGTSWSNGLPNSSVQAIISGDYSESTNLTACSLDIIDAAIVKVPEGYNFTISGKVSVATTARLTFESNANLVQIDNVQNTGNSTINRNSHLLHRLDFTSWSSPVSNENQFLTTFSPLTSLNRFYNYNEATNLYNAIISPVSTAFDLGIGYLIRTPNSFPTTPTLWNGVFYGVPNNGTIVKTITHNGSIAFGYNLIGNPYPSPINADDFLIANEASIEGSLYFWRKVNGATGSSYAVYSAAGATKTASSELPNGIIQVGQGFFVNAKTGASTVRFTNAMRLMNNENQFFKIKVESKDRFWLNLTNKSGVFSQTLIGYFKEATNNEDRFDAKYINDSPVAFTSTINNTEFSIQGRAQFTPSDQVQLQFKTDLAGEYKIELDRAEGIFATTQDLFLLDQKTGIETNLKQSPYSFKALAEIDPNRFVVKYEKSLKTNENLVNTDEISMYSKNGDVFIKSNTKIIESITIYDSLGKQVVHLRNINSMNSVVKNIKKTNQVLIVTVVFDDKKLVNEKIIH